MNQRRLTAPYVCEGRLMRRLWLGARLVGFDELYQANTQYMGTPASMLGFICEHYPIVWAELAAMGFKAPPSADQVNLEPIEV